MSKRLTLSVDREAGEYQAAFNLLNENGSGGGRRIYGPSYAGTSKPVFEVTLSAEDRRVLREYLDEVES